MGSQKRRNPAAEPGSEIAVADAQDDEQQFTTPAPHRSTITRALGCLDTCDPIALEACDMRRAIADVRLDDAERLERLTEAYRAIGDALAELRSGGEA